MHVVLSESRNHDTNIYLLKRNRYVDIFKYFSHLKSHVTHAFIAY